MIFAPISENETIFPSGHFIGSPFGHSQWLGDGAVGC
jgi:hypothetical protein